MCCLTGRRRVRPSEGRDDSMERQGQSMERPKRETKRSAAARQRRPRLDADQSVRDIMTPVPRTLDSGASVVDAAVLMRKEDIGDVVVFEHDRLCGILTDRDIVVRALAERGDPTGVTVGEIVSRGPTS